MFNAQGLTITNIQQQKEQKIGNLKNVTVCKRSCTLAGNLLQNAQTREHYSH